MSPQNWLCQRDAFIPQTTPSSQLTSGPLWWRQRRPLHQTDKNHGDSKVQFLQLQHGFRNYNEHNPSHIRWHTLPSQPSQLLITQFRLNTHKLTCYETCSTKSKLNIPCCKIKLSIKTPFDYRHLIFFIILLLFTLKN